MAPKPSQARRGVAFARSGNPNHEGLPASSPFEAEQRLHEEVTFDRSRVTSVDWKSYPLPTCTEAPRVEVALMDRPRQPIYGAGEAAAAPVAATQANAVFDATGVRL